MKFVLASASPRRLELLRGIGLDPEPFPVDLDESLGTAEEPAAAVARLAGQKARAAVRQLDPGAPALVLAADTEVVLDGRVLGKPATPEQAARMLRDLRGRVHDVVTGVEIVRTDDGRTAGGVEVTRVRFADYDDALIEAYVRTGEPFDKAGAYAIQGRGALLTAGIEGSWSNVVGLPVERLPGWFAALGLALGDLVDWTRGS